MGEELTGSENQRVSRAVYQKLERGEHLSEQERAYLKENRPELYTMAESLEQEIESWREKLKGCGTKEEVQQLKDDYELGMLLGFSVTENNQMLPLEKKLEYTMFKDMKLAIMERMVDEFAASAAYEALPDGEEAVEDVEEGKSSEEEEEERKLEQIKRSKAVSGYESSKRSVDIQGTSPFNAKG